MKFTLLIPNFPKAKNKVINFKITMTKNNSQFIIYQAESDETKIDVRLKNETVWLTQKLMAKFFDTSVPNINMHLKN